MNMEDEYFEVADDVLAREALILQVELVKRQIQRLCETLAEETPLPRKQITALTAAFRALSVYNPPESPTCRTPSPPTQPTLFEEDSTT
jgi:hypothetical protein